MNAIETRLDAGDVLHAWIRPSDAADIAGLRIELEGRAETLQARGPTRLPLPVSWRAPATGVASLAWSDADTAVSLIYAFTPATVASTGIRVIWTTAANGADPDLYRLHFHPLFGWMNDPNGLCTVDGITHLFYQHNPHTRRWDTMHWGHAVSPDGVRWTHLPIALLPREGLIRAAAQQGGAFSGTALPRPGGTLRLFYTDREDSRAPTREWQVTALSPDGIAVGPAATLLDHYPDIPGYRSDWRDPFVFTGPDGKLKMLVGGADRDSSLVLLYETDDAEGASGWQFVDVLFREESKRNIPGECPSLVPLTGEGEALWLLIFGLIGSRDNATRRRNLTRAHVGRFDGRRFEAVAEHDLDFGPDCYAMQAWMGPEGPTGIAWAANWTDVFADRDFESAMTFPRRLVWSGGHLLTPAIEAVDRLRERPLADLGPEPAALRNGLAEIDLSVVPGTPFGLVFDHPTHEMELRYDGSDVEFRYEPPGHRSVPRYRAALAGASRFRVFIDVGLIEIYVDGGRACCTKRVESRAPVAAVRLHADAGQIEKAQLWALRPASDS